MAVEEGGSVVAAIRRAARRLSRPARAGVYVSIPDMVKIAGAAGIPLAVRQDREWVAEELLKSALDYGKLDEVVQALIDLLRERIREARELAEEYDAVELVEPYWNAVEETVGELERLRELAKLRYGSGGAG